MTRGGILREEGEKKRGELGGKEEKMKDGNGRLGMASCTIQTYTKSNGDKNSLIQLFDPNSAKTY